MQELQPGAVFAGRYEIISHLHTSVISQVYTACDVLADRKQVILKILLLTHESLQLARAEFEARTLQRLTHPNIPTCEGIFCYEGTFYLIIEFRTGRTLEDVLDDSTLSVQQRLMIAQKLCQTLQYLHGEGVAHRDLKPRNVIVTFDDAGHPHVTLIDFGLVREVRQDPENVPEDLLAGTYGYIAPECVRHKMVSGAALLPADIFALGVILVELLTGEYPFLYLSEQSIQIMMFAGAPVPVNSDDSELLSLLESMLSYKPSKRPTAGMVLTAITDMLATLQPHRSSTISRRWLDSGKMTDPSIQPTRLDSPVADDS